MDGDLPAFARAIAPHVDRLAIAVHRHAAPLAGPMLRSLGLTRAFVLINGRPLLLAGPITARELAVIERYMAPDELLAGLEEQVQRGLLAAAGPPDVRQYTPTSHGLDLLLRLTALQGAAITALWAAHESDLPPLIDATTRATRAAASLPPPLYPAFRLQYAAPDQPDATPAATLLARLTAQRYLRADAHAAAWAAAGLDGLEIGALTALWRGVAADWPSAEAARERLQRRGFAERDGTTWRLTDAGHRAREALEADTDERAAPPWYALSPPERDTLLQGLARLPE